MNSGCGPAHGQPGTLGTPALQIEHRMTLVELSGFGLVGSAETFKPRVAAGQPFVASGGVSVQQGGEPPLSAQDATTIFFIAPPVVTWLMTSQLGLPFVSVWIVPPTHVELMSVPILAAMAFMEEA